MSHLLCHDASPNTVFFCYSQFQGLGDSETSSMLFYSKPNLLPVPALTWVFYIRDLCVLKSCF